MAAPPAEQLAALNVNVPSFAPKRAPGTAGTAVKVATNFFPLRIDPKLSYYKYDVRVEVIYPKKSGEGEVAKELSKKSREDFTEISRKQLCVDSVLHLTKNEAAFKGSAIIYDRSANLYSPDRLKGITEEGKTFNVPAPKNLKDAKRIDVTVKAAAADKFQVTTSNIKSCVNAEIKGTDKGLLEAANIATSRHPFLSKEFVCFGNGAIYLADHGKHGFTPQDAPALGNDMTTGIGIKKAVTVIEGDKAGGYVPAMLADVAKTPFHKEQTLADKVRAQFGDRPPEPHIMARTFRGVQCIATHNGMPVTIAGFTREYISDIAFSVNGKNVTLPQYYQQHYKITLKHTNTRAAVDLRTMGKFPLELLKVAPHQRVKANQGTELMLRELIRASAIPPATRIEQTNRLIKTLDLSSAAQQATGVHMDQAAKPIQAEARQLPAVTTLWGGNAKETGARFNGHQLFLPAQLSKWTFIVAYQRGQQREWDEFVELALGRLISRAKSIGLNLPPPIRKAVHVGRDIGSFYAYHVKEAKAAGSQFFMSICEQQEKGHQHLKDLEFSEGIPTQEIKLNLAQKAMGNQPQNVTMENILYKMNAKLGGVAHVVQTTPGDLLENDRALVIGYTVQQPRLLRYDDYRTDSQQPFIIGMSASNGRVAPHSNPAIRMTAMKQYFAATYKYASVPVPFKPEGTKPFDPRTEKPEPKEDPEHSLENVLRDAFYWTIKNCATNRGNGPPLKIYVYRGDANEGHIATILKEERKILDAAFAKLSPAYKPTLFFIGAARAEARLYPADSRQGDPKGNVLPGLVVDKTITNPELTEFYSVSHRALQGTARPTRYMLLDETKGTVKLDELEKLTYQLCHSHDIVNSTTSVPTPLYVAEEAAKRAQEQYKHLTRSGEHITVAELQKTTPALDDSGSIGLRFNA